MGELGGSPEPDRTSFTQPNPIEIVMRGLLKTNGKNADFIVVFTAEVLYL